MHICFITSEFPKPGFPHGGVGTFVATIGKALVANGIQVSVVGKNYYVKNEIETVDGIKVYRLKARKVKGLEWYLNTKVIANRISEIHLESPIDIVETADMGLAFLPKIKNISYVIRMHGGHHFFAESENRKINKWKGFQEKLSYKKADAFVAVSDYVKMHTSKYLSLDSRPVVRINSPINLQHFEPLKEQSVPYKIVFVGTVCEKKGIRQLIQAMDLIFEDFPNATLDVYGRDWFYPNGNSYIEELKTNELVKLGNMANRVSFMGIIDYSELPIKYAEAHVCAFPSHMETLGLVAPEAMCMGKPVVFTKKGPGPEIITHRVNGLLCDPHDPKDIAKQICWLFTHPEESNELSRQARNDILNKFDIDLIIKRNLKFYKTLIKSVK